MSTTESPSRNTETPTEFISEKRWEDIYSNAEPHKSLKKELVEALYKNNNRNPTYIQEATLPHTLSDNEDVICKARAGSGKTLAYVLPGLNKIENNGQIQLVILAHTHELCMQIFKVVTSYSENIPILKNTILGLFGDQDFNSKEFTQKIEQRLHVVIGLPNKVKRFFTQLYKPTSVRVLVLDEADFYFSDNNIEMYEDITKIANILKANAKRPYQTFMFTATFKQSQQYTTFLQQNMKPNPAIVVSSEGKDKDLSNLTQYVCRVNSEDNKLDMLRSILRNAEFNKAIIFCNNRINTYKLYQVIQETFQKEGVICSHGQMSKNDRTKIAHLFMTDARIRILICSDLYQRGIDNEYVNLVINFEVPESTQDFIQRTGRAGRLGRKAATVTFIKVAENESIKDNREFQQVNKINKDLKNGYNGTRLQPYDKKVGIPRSVFN